MKIGIDARFYGEKVGIGRYVEELLHELQNTDHTNRYVVFLNEAGYRAFHPHNPFFEKRLAPIRWYGIREQVRMPHIIDRENLDLIHYPHWNVPVRAKTPFVVTIHDLLLLDQKRSSRRATTLPSWLYALKHAGYRFVLRHALFASKKVIAVSGFTRDQILRYFPSVPAKKIAMIYEGVSSFPSKAAIRPVSGSYFLYVGNAYPHKNLESLLHAFSLFHKLHKEVRLVLVGKTDLFYEALRKEMEEIDIPKDAVLFAGFVPDDKLPAYYANALLYIFPSRHEGFGLPPLEAMSYGTPVAAARSASLPEVLGDAALYFDPDDIEEMIRVMEQALTDKTLRAELIEKGRERIQKFSWKKMAGDIQKVYTSCEN